MFELITASLDKKELKYLVDFPEFLKSDWERKVVSWVIEYGSRHSETPSPERLRIEFPEFTLIRADPPIPLSDVYELELEAKKNDYASAILSKSMSELRSGAKLDVDEITKMVVNMTMASSTIMKYTTFDREIYFREGQPLLTGLHLVDNATGGVYPGELMTIIGRLGTGKSTWVQFFMNDWFLNQGKRLLCISKEMPPMDVFARMDAMIGRFNSRVLRDPDSVGEMRNALKVVKKVMGGSTGEIIMPVMPTYKVEQIKLLARNLSADAVIIDGLYHLSSSRGGYASMWEEVRSVSSEVKAMALECHIPVIATTQIKRGAKAEVYDPEDIAYSDAIGQDADFILAIKNVPSSTFKHRSEMQLIKNRQGPEITTVIETEFETMSYEEVLGAT
jgi:replicative DNA helicase